jgi:hypothetical protein
MRTTAWPEVAGDRDQLMLVPPSVEEWLPDDHPLWLVLDVVAELNLSAFMPRIGGTVVVEPPSRTFRTFLIV